MVKNVKIIKLLTICPTDWIVVLRTFEKTLIRDGVAVVTTFVALNHYSCTFGKTRVVIIHT